MQLRRSLSFANVTSMLALTVALGGTSYAAVTVTGQSVRNESLTGSDVKNDSLTGRDIKNGSIKGSDIANGNLTGRDILKGSIGSPEVGYGSLNGDDIADGSLSARDFASGALAGGSQGPKGDAGANGADGAKGADGARGADGTAGAPGADGAAVVNRTRLATPFTPAANATDEAVPLTDNTWTQGANETDQLLGVASVTKEALCGRFGGATLQVFVSKNDGPPQPVGRVDFFSADTRAIVFSLPALLETGTTTKNVFSATFFSNCDNDATKRYALTDLKINVIGFH